MRIQNIVIYAGEGTFKPSVEAIRKRLGKLDPQKYALKLADEKNLLSVLEKTENIALLILSPGNACSICLKLQQREEIVDQIDFRRRCGMNILGICAGTILACKNFYER